MKTGGPEARDPDDVLVVRGIVELGDQRGRQLGFPTANLALDGEQPRNGVWAGWLDRSDGQRLPAAISVGRRSTFYGREGVRLLEAHVVDFVGDLYGESITVWLVRRLRGQRTFSGLEALVEQLAVDVAVSRTWCATTSWTPPGEPPDSLTPGRVLRVAN